MNIRRWLADGIKVTRITCAKQQRPEESIRREKCVCQESGLLRTEPASARESSNYWNRRKSIRSEKILVQILQGCQDNWQNYWLRNTAHRAGTPQEFGGNPKEAFSNLDKNPIWLNKEKGISIKRVSISGVSNAEALHHKKDLTGKDMLDSEGKRIPSDFVSTGNNHHVAIYRDEKGDLQEEVVSFYEAVARVNAGLR